jgi:hypothetical protein
VPLWLPSKAKKCHNGSFYEAKGMGDLWSGQKLNLKYSSLYLPSYEKSNTQIKA